MTFSRRIVVVGALVLITYANAYPGDSRIGHYRQPRQDEDDDGASNPGFNFGASVAQIIAGAFTGNLDSIIKGSFGFIGDPTVSKLSHNTWETLKGNPTKTPPWVTTEAGEEGETEPSTSPTPPVRAPQIALVQLPPPATQQIAQQPLPPVAAQTAFPPLKEVPPVVDSASHSIIDAAPSSSASAAVQASPTLIRVPPAAPIVETAPAQSFIYAPDVYYPGSPLYPTKIPAFRTTRPTYATLAPLSVVEGITEKGSEEKSTLRATTEDEDDGGDESEGLLSEEQNGNSVGSSGLSKGTAAPIVSLGKGTTVATNVGGANVETTTEDDEEQIDYNYRLKD